MKCNQFRPRFELVSPCPFPTTITITQPAPPQFVELDAQDQIDIICIQEHRFTHTEHIKYQDTGNGWTLATVSGWKNSVNATVGGVGMLIGPRALKSLNSIERIQPRMMAATFNGNIRARLKLRGKERLPLFLCTHGKQHDGREDMRINTLKAKRNS